MEERNYWLGFSVFPGIGPKRFRELLSQFGSASEIWEREGSELQPVLGKVFTKKFVAFRASFMVEKYLEQLQQQNVWFVTLEDAAYPRLLAETENPPFVLYGRGDKNILCHPGGGIPLRNDIFIGIVGTRKITSYGKQVTEMITSELVNEGCIIVSGFAMGVDAVAHKTTIDNNGKTIAVLGSGVDVCYPAVNENLYNTIITSGGAVISEYPLGALPSKGSFPARNRIIAGLSSGVVVTEGAEDSGALITADDAFKFGRYVFAVPGPITSTLSQGPNSLLIKGAKLVRKGADILQELGQGQRAKGKKVRKIKGDTKEEQQIITLLKQEAMSFDEIVKHLKSSAMTVGTILSLMELKGMVIQTEGGYTLRT